MRYMRDFACLLLCFYILVFSPMSKVFFLHLICHDRRIQLHEVPSDIFSLQQLRILDLSQNSLQSVPVVIYIFLKKQILNKIMPLSDLEVVKVNIDWLGFSIGARQTWKMIHVVHNRLQNFVFLDWWTWLFYSGSFKSKDLISWSVYWVRKQIWQTKVCKVLQVKTFGFHIEDVNTHGSEVIIFSLVSLFFLDMEGHIFHIDHVTGWWIYKLLYW